MPCYNSRDREGANIMGRKLSAIEATVGLPEIRDRLNFITDLLCHLCSDLEYRDMKSMINNIPDLAEWWAKHRAYDRASGRAVRGMAPP